MSRTIKEGYTIIVKLSEECGYTGYSVKCTYKYINQKGKYSLSMWIVKNGYHDDLSIGPQEIDTKYITSTKENIEKDIRRIVTDASLSGYFDEYINRFESYLGGSLLYV